MFFFVLIVSLGVLVSPVKLTNMMRSILGNISNTKRRVLIDSALLRNSLTLVTPYLQHAQSAYIYLSHVCIYDFGAN